MAKSKTPKPESIELAQLEQKVADLTQALQVERADAINMRRRHDDELVSLRVRIKANVVRDLLPAIDNLERALKHTPDHLKDDTYVKGVEAVVKQFNKNLEDIGVKRIKTVNEPFDPKVHEAVSLEEGGGSEEIVSEELQSGYIIGDEVVRHAMVRVSTK
jgi:molecular chaperone GrpE